MSKKSFGYGKRQSLSQVYAHPLSFPRPISRKVRAIWNCATYPNSVKNKRLRA